MIFEYTYILIGEYKIYKIIRVSKTTFAKEFPFLILKGPYCTYTLYEEEKKNIHLEINTNMHQNSSAGSKKIINNEFLNWTYRLNHQETQRSKSNIPCRSYILYLCKTSIRTLTHCDAIMRSRNIFF